MRINIYAHLIIIEILDDIYARAQTWSTVEYGRPGPWPADQLYDSTVHTYSCMEDGDRRILKWNCVTTCFKLYILLLV